MNKLILTVLASIITALSVSQPNFTGTWVFMEKKVINGPDYANSLPKEIKINQYKDSIVIESINIGADGKDVMSKQTIAFDSKSFTSTSKSSNRKYTRNCQWSADKTSLIITTVYCVPGNENEVDFTRIDTWSLSSDRNQLITDRKSVEAKSENWETQGRYQKQ